LKNDKLFASYERNNVISEFEVDSQFSQLLDSEGKSIAYLILSEPKIKDPIAVLDKLVKLGADLSVRTMVCHV
jgi:hypothetical protein